MKRTAGFVVGRVDRWRPATVPAVATGLVLLERALTDQLGSPVALLGALGDLGSPGPIPSGRSSPSWR